MLKKLIHCVLWADMPPEGNSMKKIIQNRAAMPAVRFKYGASR
jgi:hypothetical protein